MQKRVLNCSPLNPENTLFNTKGEMQTGKKVVNLEDGNVV